MRNNFFDRKIPTVLGLMVIIVGIIITTLLVKSGSLLQIKAAPSEDPKNVQITNITDASFTVSYTTDDQVVGSVSYGINSNAPDQTALDDRDQQTQRVTAYKTHMITVKNLTANSPYFFTITSGDKKYLNNNTAYKVSTGPIIQSSPTSHEPLSGKVIMPDGSVPPEGLVYLVIKGAQKISTYLDSQGNYTIPLNNIRNTELDSYTSLDPNTLLNLEVNSAGMLSSITISPDEINPVPIITLSNSYDFSSLPGLNSSPSAQTDEALPSVGVPIKTAEPKILSPESDESIKDQQPNFKGTAAPNQTVEITIHSTENIKTQVVSDSTGSWSYRPTTKLSPGEHTITITTKNSKGVLQTITQQFTVFAAGTQVSGNATPSATLTPTKTPTPTKIALISSSPTPSVVLAEAISETPVPSVSAAPTLLPTGNSSVIIVTIAALAAACAGIFLFLLTRGQSSL